jgi:hypothetical protein
MQGIRPGISGSLSSHSSCYNGQCCSFDILDEFCTRVSYLIKKDKDNRLEQEKIPHEYAVRKIIEALNSNSQRRH